MHGRFLQIKKRLDYTSDGWQVAFVICIILGIILFFGLCAWGVCSVVRCLRRKKAAKLRAALSKADIEVEGDVEKEETVPQDSGYNRRQLELIEIKTDSRNYRISSYDKNPEEVFDEVPNDSITIAAEGTVVQDPSAAVTDTKR